MSAARAMSRRQARDVASRTQVIGMRDYADSTPSSIADELVGALEAAQTLYGSDYRARLYLCDRCSIVVGALAPGHELPAAGYPCGQCGSTATTAIGEVIGGPCPHHPA